MVYQGPVKPGTSEKKFRETGKSEPLFQGPVPLGGDVETFRESGVTKPIATSGGAKIARIEANERFRQQQEQERQSIEEQKKIEAMREAGRQRLAEQQAQKAQQTAQNQKLVKALEIREDLRQEAEETGQPMTSLQIQRALKKRGSSISELRKATKVSQETFRKTGVSIPQQIREQRRQERIQMETQPAQTTSEFRLNRYDDGSKVTNMSIFEPDGSGDVQGAGFINPGSLVQNPGSLVNEVVERQKNQTQKKYDFMKIWNKELTVPIFFGTGAEISMSEIEAGLEEEFGTAGGVVGFLLPKTYGEGTLMLGTGSLFKVAPPLLRIGLSSGIGLVGTQTALDTSRPKDERIAGGIIGGLGIAGAISETTPYIRGVYARLSSKYKPVKTQPKGFQAIETGDDTIGLIYEGSPAKTGKTSNVELPSTSQLVRGGFEVKPSEKYLFLGDDQSLATSQISLFKPKKDIALNREFFVTPQEPFLKIPTTRLSRLGLTDLLKIQRQSRISFGIPGRSQIGILRGGTVTRSGGGSSFKIGSGSELEATRGAGTIITNVEKTGVTTIRGQGVDLFSFDIGLASAKPSGSIITSSTTDLTSRVSGESLLSGIGLSSIVKPTKTTTTTTTPTVTSFVTARTPTKTVPTIITAPTPSRRIGSPTRTTTPITPSKPTTISPPVTTTISPPKKPTIPIYPPTRPLIQGSIPGINKARKPFYWSYKNLYKQPKQSFSVAVRRGGVFKTIATTKDLQRALQIGAGRTKRTVAATFRIRGKTKPIKLPGYRTKTGKDGLLFIEKRSRRIKPVLSGSKEFSQLFQAKQRRGKRSKKKKS